MARLFNGTSNKIAVGSITGPPNGAISISLWFYATIIPIPAGDYGVILDIGGQSISVANTKMAVYTNAGSYDNNGAFTIIQKIYYHLAISINAAGVMTACLNGVLDKTVAGCSYASGSIATGIGSQGAIRFFPGRIADVAIWNNIGLDRVDINNLATGWLRPNQIKSANLAYYWPLSGFYSPEPDLGPNGKVGTLTGTTREEDPPQFRLVESPFDMSIIQSQAPAFLSGWSRQSNLPVIGGGTF